MKLTLDLHDASKELPIKSCRVAFIQAGESDGKILFMGRLSYSAKHKCFNADDWDTKEQAANTAIGMRDGCSTYWSYLPESLKEKEGN